MKPQPQPAPKPQPSAAPQPQVQPAPPATPAFSLSGAAASAPLPQPQSNLPWAQPAAEADWDISQPGQTEGWGGQVPESASEPAMHMPPQADLYKPVSTPAAAPRASAGPASIPGASSKAAYTPELPGQRRKTSGTPWALVAVAVIVVAVGGGYVLLGGQSGASASLANLTQRGGSSSETQPLLPPPENAESSSFAALPESPTSPSAVIAFADVPDTEASEPIVATGDEEIPQGLFAKLQEEVEKARERKDGTAPTDTALTPEPGTPTFSQEDLQKELAAYRAALAGSANPAELKPNTFEPNITAQTDAQLASGALLPPPAGTTPPTELYTHNPNNLPVVAEPVINAPERVRTLADFTEAEPYLPEREKVEIPANIKPKLAATDFPSLEVLSFVPGQGIVAFADGREGVLLIGESINGWELVAVNADTAEFRAGQKSYQLSANH